MFCNGVFGLPRRQTPECDQKKTRQHRLCFMFMFMFCFWAKSKKWFAVRRVFSRGKGPLASRKTKRPPTRSGRQQGGSFAPPSPPWV
jgi:hypothetical protein